MFFLESVGQPIRGPAFEHEAALSPKPNHPRPGVSHIRHSPATHGPGFSIIALRRISYGAQPIDIAAMSHYGQFGLVSIRPLVRRSADAGRAGDRCCQPSEGERAGRGASPNVPDVRCQKLPGFMAIVMSRMRCSRALASVSPGNEPSHVASMLSCAEVARHASSTTTACASITLIGSGLGMFRTTWMFGPPDGPLSWANMGLVASLRSRR